MCKASTKASAGNVPTKDVPALSPVRGEIYICKNFFLINYVYAKLGELHVRTRESLSPKKTIHR
jgi:hypothetical protein